MLSPSTISAAKAVGTGAGRRGSQKIVIFETDGVPNSYRKPTFNARGFNSYYTLGGVTSAGNGDTTGIGYVYSVIQQMVKPMAATATTSGGGPDSGLSLPNAPARIYPIAFGDLFDEDLAPNATYRPTAQAFLAKCAEYGGTGTPGAITPAGHASHHRAVPAAHHPSPRLSGTHLPGRRVGRPDRVT